MFRLCLLVILLNTLHFDMKITSVCMGKSVAIKSAVYTALRKLMKFKGEVRNLISEINVQFDHKYQPPPLLTSLPKNNISSSPENKKSEPIIYPIKVNIETTQTTAKNIISRNITIKTRTVLPVKIRMRAIELIASLGFKYETHTISTTDGYVLTMQRMLPNTSDAPNRTVILHHGLLGSSEDWLLLGAHLSLPYLLTDKGYDVWLLNARGNKYSRKHRSLYVESSDYWDFSWHEMGVYDLPASISYISKKTHNADLYFVGHSMGASALLVLLSSLPEYNDILKSAFLLAPLAYMHHTHGPLNYLADIHKSIGISALQFLGNNEFMPNGAFPQYIIDKFCKGNERSCLNPMLLITNGGELFDDNVMASILDHVPAGGSATTVLHYIQLVKSRKFCMYDYGMQDNIKKYKRKYPPKYNLESISLSISVFSSPSDWLSSSSNVKTLLHKVKNISVHHIVRRDNFGHMDFVWAKDAAALVFSVLLDSLEKIYPNNVKNIVTEQATTPTVAFTENEIILGDPGADTFILSKDV